MHGESSSDNYPKKCQRSATTSLRTEEPQTFKLVFFKNVILLLLPFKKITKI